MAEKEKLFLDKERAKTDAAYFAERILNFKGFNYQEEIDWTHPRILIRGARRTGKDTIVAHRRIIPFMFNWWCPVRKMFIKKPKIGVYAPGWEEGDVFMEIMREAIEDSALKKSVVVNNKFEMEISNGAKILCRIASKTSTGKRGRGFDLMYGTEASFIADENMSVIRVTRLVGSAPMILASSPNGDNHFKKAEDSGKFKSYHWKTSMNPMIDPEELAIERSLMTEIEAQQELDAEYISGVGQAIADKLIEKMYEGGLQMKTKGEPGKIYVAGVDLGRRRDKSTIYVLELDWPEATIVYYREYEINKDDPRFWLKVLDHIKWAAENFRISRLKVDQTGLGDMPTMELKRVFTERGMSCIVEGVDFTYAMKHKWEGIINQGILKFERYEIHGPFIRRLVVQLKSIRFNADLKMYEVKGPSPDHVMALFLAMSCMQQQNNYFGVSSNRIEERDPLVAEKTDINFTQLVKDGYRLKASEMGPVKKEKDEEADMSIG